MDERRAAIAGSAPQPRAVEHWSSAVDPDQRVTVTITLRRRQNSKAANVQEQLLSGNFQPLSREDAAQQLGADPADLEAVRRWVEQDGMTITQENAAARTLHVQGTAAQMSQAFGVQLGWMEDAGGGRHLSYQGALSVPEPLAGIITAVLGLDQRPVARPRA